MAEPVSLSIVYQVKRIMHVQGQKWVSLTPGASPTPGLAAFTVPHMPGPSEGKQSEPVLFGRCYFIDPELQFMNSESQALIPIPEAGWHGAVTVRASSWRAALCWAWTPTWQTASHMWSGPAWACRGQQVLCSEDVT